MDYGPPIMSHEELLRSPDVEFAARKAGEIRRDDGTLYSTGDMGQ
jgi:hypothetical protein